jgi:hypothetical protein
VRALALALALLHLCSLPLRCRCADKLPTSHGAPINLAKLYREVCTRGGYNNVRFERLLAHARPSLLSRSRRCCARAPPPRALRRPRTHAAPLRAERALRVNTSHGR